MMLILQFYIYIICLNSIFTHPQADEHVPEGKEVNSSVPLILRLVSSCIPIANHAGEIIRDVKEKNELNTVDKGIQDYQTEADRRAQHFIISSLSRQFPKVTIRGEEEGCRGNDNNDNNFNERDESVLKLECPKDLLDVVEDQVTIWVDPLDGTREYTQGLVGHVTVLIGIAVGTKAVAGVINQPYYVHKEKEDRGRTIWGIVGLGAYGHTPEELPKDRVILVTTRSHSNALVEKSILSIKADEVLRVGGSGHKVLLLLEGKAHVYVYASSGCKRWDTCAPEAVLHAAGGFFTDVNGKCYSYNKEIKRTDVNNTGGILATARKEDHSKFLNLLRDINVKQSLKK